ncbi:MAG: AAA family ATPase [Rhodothermales bacterium]
MRILSADISAFGQLTDRILTDFDPGLVCFSGPNEAGKSTLQSFLVMMLFGLPDRSANREQFDPPGGRRIAGRLRYRLDDDSEHVVKRSVDKRPTGTLYSVAGLFSQEVEIGNAPVPHLQLASRRVFEKVHALTLYDLIDFDKLLYGEVRDALLGAMRFDHVRPAHEVVAELETESKKLWRADNRGNPLSTVIRERIDAALRRREEVRLGERELADLHKEIPVLERELLATRESVREDAASLENLVRLQPIVADLRRLAVVSMLSSRLPEIESLPSDPRHEVHRLSEQRDELRDNLQEVRRRKERAEVAIAAFRDDVVAVLDKKSTIDSLLGHLSQYQFDCSERSRLEEQVARSKQAAAELGDWDLGETSDLSTVLVDEIGAAVEERDRIRLRLADIRREAASVMSRRTDGRVLLFAGIATVLISGVLVAFNLRTDSFWLNLVGVLLFGIGFLSAGVGLARLRRSSRELEVLGEASVEADLTRRIESLQTILRRLGPQVEAAVISDSQVRDLRDLLAHRNDVSACNDRLREIESRTSEFESEVDRLSVFLHEKPSGVVDAVRALSGSVAESIRIRDRAAIAEAELKPIRVQEQTIESRLDDIGGRHDKIVAMLAALGAGDVSAGIRLVHETRKASDEANLLNERVAAYGKDESDKARALLESAEEVHVKIDEMRMRLTQGHSAERRLVEELEHKRARREVLSAGERLESVEDELASLRSELVGARENRDQLILLRNIVRVADRRYRETHQPDVVSRASRYIETITGGRWTRLNSRESGRWDVVDHTGRVFAVDKSLSRGTLDQIFLAVRFAIIDHLDQHGERLPVLLDEVFVNWDRTRRMEVYPMLRKLAEQRQVIVFTCHHWMREELAVHAGASIVDLEPIASLRDVGERQSI